MSVTRSFTVIKIKNLLAGENVDRLLQAIELLIRSWLKVAKCPVQDRETPKV